jgi:hypothetical protein
MYDDTQTEAAVYSTEHNNGDETHVIVCESGGAWLVVVAEHSDEYEPLESDVVFVGATEEEAQLRAAAWTESNPKGLDGGDSLLGKLGGGA